MAIRCVYIFVMTVFCLASPARATDILAINYFIADGSSEPYQIVGTPFQGVAHSGILTDILAEIARDVNVEVHTMIRPYKRVRLEILAQRFPNWISYGAPVWLDNAVMEFGEYSKISVLDFHYSLAHLKEQEQPNLNQVTNARIIVILGYQYPQAFYHWAARNNIQLLYAPSHTSAMLMLAQRRGDYYMAEDLRVNWAAKRNDIPLASLNIIDISSIIPPSKIYFLLDRRLPESLRNSFNEKLVKMRDEGEIERIVSRYR